MSIDIKVFCFCVLILLCWHSELMVVHFCVWSDLQLVSFFMLGLIVVRMGIFYRIRVSNKILVLLIVNIFRRHGLFVPVVLCIGHNLDVSCSFQWNRWILIHFFKKKIIWYQFSCVYLLPINYWIICSRDYVQSNAFYVGEITCKAM
jgi:hypothetical protein